MIFMPLNLNVVLVPFKITSVAPFRFAPLIVTDVPTPPPLGEKLVMVGGAMATTVKLVPLVAVPPSVVTAIGPVVRPEGTVAVIWTSELKVKVAVVPLKVTEIKSSQPPPTAEAVASRPASVFRPHASSLPASAAWTAAPVVAAA